MLIEGREKHNEDNGGETEAEDLDDDGADREKAGM